MKTIYLLLNIVTFSVIIHFEPVIGAFGQSGDRVRLSDVQTLTLYNGRMTNARRSPPVPQLKCVGGTASCHKFTPQVVQCYNRGSDGYDAQWECKTDMDNAYRFGRVEVTCEGYDYPDDPYILRGSCGLEYTLDLTKEGHEQQNRGEHRYYGDESYHHDYHNKDHDYYKSYHKKSTGFGDLLMLGIVVLVIYFIYKTCLSGTSRTADQSQQYPTGTDHNYSQPPPPGFRPEFMPGHDSYSSSSYSGGNKHTPGATGTGGTQQCGSGFWSGAATGGILGYLFGRNNSGYRTNYYNHHHSNWGTPTGGSWFSGWGSGRSSSYSTRSYSSSSRPSSSTGTRTASGFGGTKRR